MVGKYSMEEYQTQAEAWETVFDIDVKLPEASGNIVFFGGGVALNIARTLAFTTQVVLGRPAIAISSQDLTAYPNVITGLGADLFVSISRTGTVSDNIAAINSIRKAQPSAKVFGIVGEDLQNYGDLCDGIVHLDIHEDSVATTKTISAMTLAGQLMIARAGAPELGKELADAPRLLRSLTPAYDKLGQTLASKEFDQIVFLGSGPIFGIAEASALAVLEMSVERCLAHQPGVFMHGHFVTTHFHPTLVVSYLSDGGREAELNVLRQLCSDKVTTVCIGKEVDDAISSHKIEIGTKISDVARSILYLPFAQTLGIQRSMARGYNPDAPPNLPKVF